MSRPATRRHHRQPGRLGVRPQLPARVLDGDYVPAFELSRIVQELDSLERAATAARIPRTVATRVAELHREALGGLGDRNEELSIIRWLEQLAGHRLSDPASKTRTSHRPVEAEHDTRPSPQMPPLLCIGGQPLLLTPRVGRTIARRSVVQEQAHFGQCEELGDVHRGAATGPRIRASPE